jgi:hypothetical protein
VPTLCLLCASLLVCARVCAKFICAYSVFFLPVVAVSLLYMAA